MGLGNLFRNKYEGRSFEFKEEYWLDAMKALDAHDRRKRRRGFLLWSSAALFLLVVGMAFWMLQDQSFSDLAIESKSDETIESFTNEEISNHQMTNPDQEMDSKLNTEEMFTSNNSSTNTEVNPLKTDALNKVKSIVTDDSDNLESISNNEVSQHIDDNSLNLASNHDLNSDNDANEKASIDKISGNDYTAPMGSMDETELAQNDNDASELNVEPFIKEPTQFDLNNQSNLPYDFNKLDVLYPSISLQYEFLDVVENTKDYYKAGLGYFGLSLYGGLHNFSAQIDFSSEIKDEIKSKRNNEEKNVNSISYGIEGTYQIKGFNISTGLMYSCFGEKLDYSPMMRTEMVERTKTDLNVTSKTEEEYVDNGYWVGSESNSNGSWTYNPSSTYVHDIDTIYKVTYDSAFVNSSYMEEVEMEDERVDKIKGTNTYKAFDIPVLIGYDYNMGNFGVGLRTGMSFSYIVKQSAHYMNNESIVDVSTNQVNQWTPSLIIRPQVWYAVNEKIALYAEPQWRKQLQSVVNVSNSFSNKYESYGVNVGLKIQL